MLRGKYFIHNGKYVVSPCMPSQHGTVGPPYSFVVVTPMGLGFNTSSKAIYYVPLDYYTGSVMWTVTLLVFSRIIIHCLLYLNETISLHIQLYCCVWYSIGPFCFFYLPDECCGRSILNRPLGTVGQALFLFQHCLPVYHHLVFLIPCAIAVAA